MLNVPLVRLVAAALLLCSSACDPATGPIGELEITGAPEWLDVGETVSLGLAPPPAEPVAWESSDEAVVRVDAGVVQGVGAGSATIRAQAPGWEGSVSLNVREPVHEMLVFPSALKVIRGRKAALRVRLRDASGGAVDRPVSYTSSAEGVVTVTAAGVVETVALGAASVRVRVGARSVDVPVEVVSGASHTARGLDGMSARDLNNLGWVVGTRNGRAALWRDGVITDLHPQGATESAASAVNDAGVVAGGAIGADGAPFVWSWQDGATRIVPIGASPVAGTTMVSADPTGISASGTIVGAVTLRAPAGSNVVRGFVVSGGTFTWLPPTDPPARPAINDAGAVATGHVLIENGVTRELPAPSPEADSWYLTDIDVEGKYVGVYSSAGRSGGFRGDRTGTTSATLGMSFLAVNAYDDAAGALTSPVSCSAVCVALLNRQGSIVSLQIPGWRTFTAHAINDLGQILVSACPAQGGGCIAPVVSLLYTPSS